MQTAHRRVTAGAWYAMLAMLPGMLFTQGWMPVRGVRADEFVGAQGEKYWVFICLPALAGFLAGAFCAEKYKQPARNTALSNWFWLGLLVAFVAHTLFAVIWAVWSAITARSSDLGGYVFMTESIGLAWFGWLEAILGGCGGWLLGMYRKKQAEQESSSEARSLPSLSFPMRVLLCLLVLFAVIGTFFAAYMRFRGSYA